MVINHATSSDIDALADLLGILFLEESEFIPEKELQRAALRRIVADSNIGKVLCARDTEEEGTIDGDQSGFTPAVMRENSKSSVPIGMVSLLFTESTALGAKVALLEDMVILPKYRAMGVGSMLLRTAIEFARNCGCQRITLLTDETNHGAHRFYKAHGFNQSSMTAFRLLL